MILDQAQPCSSRRESGAPVVESSPHETCGQSGLDHELDRAFPYSCDLTQIGCAFRDRSEIQGDAPGEQAGEGPGGKMPVTIECLGYL
jgi:hypothetical protein